MPNETMTVADLAKEAIEIQNASNLSGLVLTMARRMERFNQLHPGISTQDRNTHPIWYLWVDKLSSLTGGQYGGMTEFSKAYEACEELARCHVE